MTDATGSNGAGSNGAGPGVAAPEVEPEQAPLTTWQLGTPSAVELAAEVARQDDLQAVLQCCERLVGELAPPGPPQPGVDAVVESLWRTALTAYARCFATEGATSPLVEQDVLDAHPDAPEDATKWHQALLSLAGREGLHDTRTAQVFTVGAVRGEDGAPRGIAVSASERVLPDEVVVRSAGTLAFALSRTVEARVVERQETLFAEVDSMSSADIDQLPRIQASPQR